MIAAELVVTVMSLATVSLLSSMFVSYLSDHVNPPPRWAKKVFLYYIPKMLRMSSYKLYEEELFGKKVKPPKLNKQLNDKGVYQRHFTSDAENGISPSIVDVTRTDQTKPMEKDVETVSSPSASSTDQKQKRHRKSPIKSRSSEDVVMVQDVKEILQQLAYMKGKILEEEQSLKIKDDWKHIGKTIDRIVFFICLIVLVFYVLYAYFKIHSAKN